MASSAAILEALASTPPSEQEYLAQDPYYLGARQVYGMQMPQATNNTEAILGPALQGLLGGFLQGYGRKNAAATAYQDYAANPLIKALQADQNIGPVASGEDYGDALLHAYSSDKMPEGWTQKVGKSDLLLGALAEQQAVEMEQKKAAVREELNKSLMGKGMLLDGGGGKIVPIPGYSEALGANARAEEDAKAAARGENNTPKLPAPMLQKLAASKSVIDEADTIANALLTGGTTWTELQGAKAFSGLDKEGIGLTITNLADRLARARTGAAMNKSEVELYGKIIGGDLSASPAQVGRLLKKLAEAERRIATSEIDFAKTNQEKGLGGLLDAMQSPQQIGGYPNGAIPTGKYTKSGKPIIIINGVEGVME